jgi:hypothetical protein
MPLIYFHLSIARDAAEQLGHPVVEEHLRSFLGGAISPDAHYVAEMSRIDTHFFDLNGGDDQNSQRKLFQAHPDLSRPGALDERMLAFIIGYISHLVTDEAWIKDIYRPFFSDKSPLGGDPGAHMLDRMLQYETDRWERLDREKLNAIRDELRKWDAGEKIRFINATALRNWRDFVWGTTVREVNRADLRLFAQSFLVSREKVGIDKIDPFLDELPAKVEWAMQYVTPERVKTFREKVIRMSVEAAREYLNEDNI